MEKKSACIVIGLRKMTPVRFFAVLLASFLSVQLPVFAFGKADIISPVPGTWKNRLPLVLNLAPDTELYYSLTGSDPYLSGFSYDEPVLIDESGDVTVKITAILQNGERRDFTVAYTVEEDIFSEAKYSPETLGFLRSVASNPVKEYGSGTELVIPEEFAFSLGNSGIPRFSGSISLSENNTVERYVPCTIADFENSVFLHFAIHVVPLLREPPEKNPAEKLPFEIAEWNSVSFTDRSYIYQIDSENWQPPQQVLRLDRTAAHTIRWQPVGYSKENPVHEYKLPAKPKIYSKRNKDSSVSFFIDGDSRYSFAASSPSACADAFSFEDITANALLNVYCDGVFQGIIESPFSIDRLPPEKPEILYAAESSLPGKTPSLSFKGEAGTDIFFAVSGPHPVSQEQDGAELELPLPADFGSYQPFSGRELPLSSGTEEPVFYAVKAYAADAAGNRSFVAERNIVIDGTNYYLCAQPQHSGLEDGSRERPFSSFDQFASVLHSSSKKLNLHVYGEVKMPAGKTEIKKDCVIIGHSAVLSFESGSGLTVCGGSSVSFKGLVLERPFSTEEEPLVSIKNASASFSGCELSGIFAESGILVEAQDSSVNFLGSVLTVQGGLYACAVLCERAQMSCTGSQVSSVARASVNFRISGGTGLIEQSDFYAAGSLCRGIEASRSSLSLRGNRFTARRDSGAQKGRAVLHDAQTQLLADEENVFRGF